MMEPVSDALVFFGATGDLAYKQIFPSLQRLAKRDKLKGPVIGVAKSGWTLDDLKKRARESWRQHGGLDPEGFDKLMALLRYVDGDYGDIATFRQVRKELGTAQASDPLPGDTAKPVRRGAGAIEAIRMRGRRARRDRKAVWP